MKVTMTSDTHNHFPPVEDFECDVAIHAGDFTMNGYMYELEHFINVFKQIKAPYKIFIAGNHDFVSEEREEEMKRLAEQAGLIYLRDSAVTIDSIKIYGTPWTKKLKSWAWQVEDHPQGDALWNGIPDDADIVITHSPPHGIADRVNRLHDYETDYHVGNKELRKRIEEVKPQLHVFGHIHEGYTPTPIQIDGLRTKFVNAAYMNRNYRPTNAPVTVTVSPADAGSVADTKE